MFNIQHLRITSLLIVIGLLASCATNVYTDYETQHDFSQYTQFEWTGSKTTGEAYEAFGGDIYDSRLNRAISNVLESKGISNGSDAQFGIQYSLATTERAYYNNDIYYGRYYLRGHPYFHSIYSNNHYRHYNDSIFARNSFRTVRYYTVGTLTVQIVDKATDRVVWVSKARTILSENNAPAENEQKINELAVQMFGEFPPNNVITL